MYVCVCMYSPFSLCAVMMQKKNRLEFMQSKVKVIKNIISIIKSYLGIILKVGKWDDLNQMY